MSTQVHAVASICIIFDEESILSERLVSTNSSVSSLLSDGRTVLIADCSAAWLNSLVNDEQTKSWGAGEGQHVE